MPQRTAVPGNTPVSHAPHAPHTTRTALRWELAIVLAITFGMSGVRAILRLLETVINAGGLRGQRTTLNGRLSDVTWLDPVFQILSSVSLIAWGALGLFLLLRHLPVAPSEPGALIRTWRIGWRDLRDGCALAAVIGIPGLGFYLLAVQLGLSKTVIPSGAAAVSTLGLGALLIHILTLTTNAWANGFAEELVVVGWLGTRLRQLGWSWATIAAASAVLRGSYHLYQGYSAGLGNVVMGLIYFTYTRKTGRIWPLVIGHALIDTVAFLGSMFLR